MNTYVARRSPDDDRLRKAPHPGLLRRVPQAGDIVACERSARADVFSITTVPNESEIVAARYSEVIARVQELARMRGVDGWYTCDHTHYARVARYRP